METVLTAVLIMTGLGVFFALVLASADHFLGVELDPNLEAVDELLPGTNCGACGEPGCRALAEKIVRHEATPGQCTVSSPAALEAIAHLLGVEVGVTEKRVARLKCAGSEGLARRLATYRGIRSCRAAVLIDGGGRSCGWGCLGLADCERACTFNAIRMLEGGLPQVDIDLCTACGDCVDVCPLDLFTLMPLSEKLFVQCSSPLEGDAARLRCSVACDACGRCAADAADVIEMTNGLPRIRYDREAPPSARSTWRCPTGAIVWLEGEQFADTPVDKGAADG